MCHFSSWTLVFYLLGIEGGEACVTARDICFDIFDRILAIAGDINV
jgi:hypothetical protein